MKILITGSNGMLAKSVKNRFNKEELICTNVEDLDITNKEKVIKFIEEIKPNYIINCAAYTDADKAEENKEVAEKINSIGPKNLAIAANNVDATLIHISTDYVFGGEKDVKEDYKEDDEKKTTMVYGITKLKGEENILDNTNKYYIFRTAWLYGEGKNFVRTMLKLGKENEEVKVVSDQHGSPTYAVDLVDIIAQAIEKKIPYGIYHATNLGYTTWYEFTKDIFEIANIKCKVQPVTTEEFPRTAKRPKNSQLSKEKLLSQGIVIPEYKDALKRYLKQELN